MRCTVRQSVHRIYPWDACMSGETVLFWNERCSVQLHREDIIGVWVCIDCRSIVHVFVHSHRGGGQWSQLWTQCAGCQSSTGGGRILTAGEKEKQWTELEVIALPTSPPKHLKQKWVCLLHALVYLIYHTHIMSNEVSTLSLLMPNYLLPRSYHSCRSWEAKQTHLTLLIFYQFPSSKHTLHTTHEQFSDLMQTWAPLTLLHGPIRSHHTL